MNVAFGPLLWLLLCTSLHVLSTPTGYLIWGTPFLYQSEKFDINPTALSLNGPTYQKRFGFRGQHYIANLNQSVVETNNKLFDVEDSTKSYKSPLSHW